MTFRGEPSPPHIDDVSRAGGFQTRSSAIRLIGEPSFVERHPASTPATAKEARPDAALMRRNGTPAMAEVAVTGPMVRAMLAAIRRLRAPPLCT